jgi:hypothetical protein
VSLLLGSVASALPYQYPAVRYVSPLGESLGGMTLPLSDEIGNSLFNNPAALARNTKFKAEYLNLNIDGNTNLFSSISSVPSFFSLGQFTTTLNTDPNQVYSGGFGNLTALSWGGLGVGVLIQDRVRSYSDGSTVSYESLSQVIPVVGYGLSLARGLMRVGYSIQYVNETSGTGQAPSDSSAAYLSGINQGKGLSHTASVNFVFPFQHIPTLSFVARNVFGMRFQSGSLLSRAKSPVGTPSDQELAVDAAFNFMSRISGPMKSFWYLQMQDVFGKTHLGVFDRLSLGIDFNLSQAVSLRIGLNKTRLSGGIGYHSPGSEIGLAYYQDQSPFTALSATDTRIALQYKIFFQDQNVRDRDAENKAR